MEKIVLLFLTLCGMLLADDLIWQKDLESAFALADKEHRTVMVMVEGEHCRWCKKMRYRTLGNDRVIAALKSFITVRVDEADETAMKILPPVQGVPTIFFLQPDKKVIETVTGYYGVDDFLSFVKDVKRQTWQVQ